MRKALRIILLCSVVAVGVASWVDSRVHAQQQTPYQLNLFYYYPYYYFPHNYWPAQSPKWPEAPNQPYQKPPAYMAYPPFLEPNWRYELWQAQRYHRGFHFWLDQF